MITTAELVRFCQRVGTLSRSGVDARRVWEGEASHGRPAYRRATGAILDHVKQGDTIAEGMRASGFFPEVAVAMVEIGEHTGRVDQALARLGEHYELQLQLRRQFVFGIAWPAIQLTAAILIIGLLIYVLGVLGATTLSGKPVDVTGLGLSGARGVTIYFLTVGFVVTGIAAGVLGITRGAFGTRPLQLIQQLPVVGPPLRFAALSRLTWSLGMALDAGMDAKRSVELALLSTQNSYYQSRTSAVVATIARNQEFYEAFRDAEAFPDDFLLELETAEISGTLSEALVRMSNQYMERAKTALRVLVGFCTAAIWVLVAAIMIFMIFRLATLFIFQPMNDALEMTKPRGT
jgi:type II secretory pathway component PulF